MPNEPKIQALAAAASNLCAAHEDLLAAGYNRWSIELKELIDTIGLELDWLEASIRTAAVVQPRL